MPDTVPQERLEEILAAAEKATPGEWITQLVMTDGPERGEGYIVAPPTGGLIGAALPQPLELESGDFSRVVANAAHIANCDPQTITAIIKELLSLRTDTAALRAQVVEPNWQVMFFWSDAKRRQWWITRQVAATGKLNRADICQSFDVSVPQASADIRAWIEAHPAALEYDKSAKCYVAASSIRSLNGEQG